MGNQMAARGYFEMACTHLGKDSELPPPINADRARPPSAARRSLAPANLRVDKKLPECNNTSKESAAAQIIREWELHTKVGDEYFSPLYLFVVDGRAQGGRPDSA